MTVRGLNGEQGSTRDATTKKQLKSVNYCSAATYILGLPVLGDKVKRNNFV
jgi:hypothetical protein